MLSDEKNDLLYLLNIVEHIEKIRLYASAANSSEDLFELNEQMNLNASLALLANIGENVSKISNSLKTEYSNIAWQQIKDFRNKVVHDYVGIDLEIVYEIITKDLSALKHEIEKIIIEKLRTGIFNIEEFVVCKDSLYYKHVEFEKLL